MITGTRSEFNTAVAERRSFYSISNEAVTSDDEIQEIIELAIKHTPTAYNSQSGRVVLLLGKQHDRLWEITKEALVRVVATEEFLDTEERVNAFANGYGTILFFEDQGVVKTLEKRFRLYRDNFPIWSQQSSGILQYIIWTGLENIGYGASLQHYTELIEKDVKKEWEIEADWKLIAQMPFGKPIKEPDEKEYQPVKERIMIYR